MNNEELKNLLNSKHINSWVKIYKDDPVVQDHLFSLYNKHPSTDSEIYALFYLVMYDITEYPIAYCGDEAKFIKYGKGFRKFCNKYERSLKEESCECCHTRLYEERNKKAKVTNKEKYGNEVPQRTDIIKQKVKDTNIERYGVESHNSTEEVKNKKIKSYQERYGVDNPSQLDEVKEKIITGNQLKYNTDYYFQSSERFGHDKVRRMETIMKLCGDDYEPLFTIDDMSQSSVYMNFKCKHCGVVIESQTNTRIKKCSCQKMNGTSYEEKQLLDFIKSVIPNTKVIESECTVIYPKELDIYIPDLDMAFEYNGLYWHSTAMDKPPKYHQQKVLNCMKKNINLVHIFEDEWNDPTKKEIIKNRIKNKLLSSTKIYARKCVVREISSHISNSFVDEHHIQGSTNASIHFGLFYNDELVAVMTFGKSRFDKNIEYELIRYCSTETVVGGASKLLKAFERSYNPESIISYADMNWSRGNLYETIGFKNEGYTVPGYFYYDPKHKIRISRQKCQKHKLIKAGYDPSLTETEICCNILGYYKIYDSGNWKFVKHYKE